MLKLLHKKELSVLIGAGGCHNSGNPKAEVMVFVEDDNEQTLYIIEKLRISSYMVCLNGKL